MIRIAFALCALAGAFVLNACCCATGEPAPPPLRPLPDFAPMPAAPQVIYEK
jgi:hypothetical protein